LHKHGCFVPTSPSELTFMTRFKAGELVVEPGTALLMEGFNSPRLFTVLSGHGHPL
jgi:CRP/FNR family transcriptional regulator